MQELDFAHITDVLARTRSLKPNMFGAEHHSFRLNPKMWDTEVHAFEKAHNITLPEDYRKFVTEIANGGAGPFYGIFPLGQMDDNFSLRTWRERDGFVGILSKPFPHESEWNDISLMPSDDLAAGDASQYDNLMEVFENYYWQPSLVNGAIPICHKGCALRVWLVVTGKQAGYLWDDRRSEYAGLKPLRLRDGSKATFSRWYAEWLEECSAATANNRSL